MSEIHIGKAVDGPLKGQELRSAKDRIIVPTETLVPRVYSWRSGAWWYDLEKTPPLASVPAPDDL